jgi:hypothetical protein
VAVAATALLLLIGSPSTAQHREGPCDFHLAEDETVQQYSKRHIRCAVETFGPVNGGAERAICIAKRESGLIPTAASPTSMYLGLYQHAAEYWDWRYERHTEPEWELPPRALSGRTNAIVTVRMVAAADGIWPDAGWPRGDC